MATYASESPKESKSSDGTMVRPKAIPITARHTSNSHKGLKIHNIFRPHQEDNSTQSQGYHSVRNCFV